MAARDHEAWAGRPTGAPVGRIAPPTGHKPQDTAARELAGRPESAWLTDGLAIRLVAQVAALGKGRI